MRQAFADEQAEVAWTHWQQDRMRDLMRELTQKRPTDEWRRRMERMHTALDLSERDNSRLRAELSRTASIAVAHEGGDAAAAATAAAAAAAVAAAAVSKGGLSEDLLARYEALQVQAAQTEEALRLARRSAASQEAYLGVLQAEAQENASRNEAQQRKLEQLTAETSKLKKEATRLRSEATGARMASFEHDMLKQELGGAKEAVMAMEAQLQRLHAENRSLREGGGLTDEIALVTQQLREALHAKSELQLALTSQVRRAHAEVQAGVLGIASADADLDAAAEIARVHEARAVATRQRELEAVRLVDCTHRLTVVERDRDLRWALHAWRSALQLVELVDVFHDVSARAGQLGAASEAMA